MTIQNREQWLTKATDLLIKTELKPAMQKRRIVIDRDVKIAVSIGHPKSKNAIGECWATRASEDKETNNIFITPFVNDSVRILDVLLHELIHAYDDNESGHKNRFATLARAVGLEGKLTATIAGDALKERLLDIVDVLGDIPHVKIDLSQAPQKKQKGRMRTIHCIPCDFRFSASRTQLERIIDRAYCPCCSADISEELTYALES